MRRRATPGLRLRTAIFAAAVAAVTGCGGGEDPVEEAAGAGPDAGGAEADHLFADAISDAAAAAARGRLGAAASLARAAELRAAELDDVDAALRAAVLPGLWRLWATGEADIAIAAVEAALERRPIDAITGPREIELILAAFFADAGQAQRGRAFLARYVREARPSAAGEPLRLPPVYYSARGALGLAERRFPEAIRALERAATSQSPDPLAPGFRLGLAWERAGARDSAARAYERFLEAVAAEPGGMAPARVDAWAIPYALAGLGDAYEAGGASSRAAAYMERFIRLWEGADPPLRPEVLDMRARLRALSDPRSTGG